MKVKGSERSKGFFVEGSIDGFYFRSEDRGRYRALARMTGFTFFAEPASDGYREGWCVVPLKGQEPAKAHSVGDLVACAPSPLTRNASGQVRGFHMLYPASRVIEAEKFSRSVYPVRDADVPLVEGGNIRDGKPFIFERKEAGSPV